MNQAIDGVRARDTRNSNYQDYLMGDNVLQIAFNVTENSMPVDFKKLSSWGDQYVNAITEVMSIHLRMPPGKEPTYFNLLMTKNDGNTIGYRYYFSVK